MFALRVAVLSSLLLAFSTINATSLSDKAVRELRNEIVVQRSTVVLDPRQGPKQYITILRGLLRSRNIIKDISKIPCNVIQTLETDVDAAKDFVTQLEHDKIPDIITHLPQEVIDTFHDVVHIAASLPTEIFDAAQAVVTDAVQVFNDITFSLAQPERQRSDEQHRPRNVTNGKDLLNQE